MTNNATLHTSRGAIALELFAEGAPKTVDNFVRISREGFYDGIAFHRVIPDFMVQAGDPLSKDPADKGRWGTGGPGYNIKDEFGPGLRHHVPGMLSMANAGPNTGGSQFFITVEPTPWLDGKHAIFGKVAKGMEVVRTIVELPRDRRDVPLRDAVIAKASMRGA